jgi:hypothetical protein
MKTMRWIGLALLFALAPSVPAFAAGGYATARDLQTDCRTALKFAELVASVSPKLYDAGYCYGFLSGVADTLLSPSDYDHAFQ